jgi:competence protein ComEC
MSGENLHHDLRNRENVLAISGLHVGILLVLIWGICNLLNLPPNWRAAVVLCTLFGYTLLTDIRPPVLRASILGVLFLVGHRLSRPISARNLLAVSAIIILLWRPTDLFDAGAQLSFLCVATIIEVSHLRWMQPRLQVPVEGETWWQMFRRQAGRFGRGVLRNYLTSLSIWLAAIPLAAWHFQLLTPIGTLLNVLLVPLSPLLLWPGFLFLGVGMISPLLASPFAAIFDFLIGAMLYCVELGAAIEYGHFFVPTPPLWWVIGFYILLGGAFTWIRSANIIRWSRRSLLIWTVLGLLPLPHPADRSPDELRLSFLPVGHGGCVLIECPSGQTIMFDCGSFGDGDRAAQMVFATMSARGLTRIDALLISHADSDHYNGVIPLLERVPVSAVGMPRSFLDFEQTLVESTCDAIAIAGIPMRILAAGDALQIDPEVTLRVLHPDAGFVGESDNAESLVVLIEYAGRRMLLMGDLERAGFETLARDDLDGPVDILQSPHHGSPGANTAELRDWADPTWMVVCAGFDADIPRLNATFTESRVMSTAISGTVTFTIDSGGEVQVAEHLQPTAVVDD